MYDLLNDNLPHQTDDYFSYIDHMYNTRNKQKGNFKIGSIKTNLGKQTISHSGAIIWNNLPITLRNLNSRKKFCKAFKLSLLQEYQDVSL